MASTYTKFHPFVEHVCEKTHNLGADTLKVALASSQPLQASDNMADIDEIEGINGYPSGGLAVTITGSSETGGTYSLFGNDVTFTASGAGGFDDFRYAVLYNDTATSPVADPVIAYWDYGSVVNLDDGESFTVDFASPILDIPKL